MSESAQSISQQLDSTTAKLKNHADALTRSVPALQKELGAALASMKPGSVITQEQVDALADVQAQFAALVGSLGSAAADPAA